MDFVIEVTKWGSVERRKIQIERVPYGVFKINQEVEKRTAFLAEAANREAELEAELAIARKDKDKEKIKDVSNELQRVRKDGLSIVDENFFDQRFEAIKLILGANGIGEKDDLMNIKTWERNIDFTVPTALIHIALSKDLKKALAAIK